MGEKFNIIYADPPWKFQTYSERGSQLKSADCHYSCMKFDDILSLPVESIAAARIIHGRTKSSVIYVRVRVTHTEVTNGYISIHSRRQIRQGVYCGDH